MRSCKNLPMMWCMNMNRTKEFFQSYGHKLSVCIEKSDKKENILLLHGFNDNQATFYFIRDFLQQRFNVYSFDFRGHGDSDWKTDGIYHAAETLADIHNIICYYLPQPFHLLGHSMGGGFAARYTGLQPHRIKSLVCLEGFADLLNYQREKDRILHWLDTMYNRREKGGMPPARAMSFSRALDKLKRIYQNLDDETLKILAQNLLREQGSGFQWKADPNIKLSNPIPYPPQFTRFLWQSISCPVKIIYGEKSHLRPAGLEEILSHFSDLAYSEIAGSGHNMHHDNPDELGRLLDEFYKKQGF